MSLDRKPEDYVADYTDFCRDVGIDPNQESSIKSYANEYARWHIMFKGIGDVQTDIFDLENILKNKEKYTIDESINLKESKLLESHLDDYSSDKEYDVTYIDDKGKEKQIKFKPNKNTNIAGIQKQLGETYKDFFKLKEIKGGEKMQESKDIKDLTLAERILLNAIKTVNSAYDLDNVVCTTIPSTGDVLVSTKDGKDICTIARHKFAINGDDTELIDELRFNGYWKEPDFEDKDTLEEEVLIEKDGKYDTMAFAQWLPMSFTDYVDSHIKDDYEEMGSNYNKIENFIEDYVLQYQEDHLDAEEQEEFEYDLAKDYVRYKLDNIEKKEEKVLTSSNGKFKKGDIYVNGNGALIRITDYTKSGTPQYDIGMPTDFAMGTYTCKGMASDEELQALLDNNGYRKISESREIKTEASALSAKDEANTVIVNKNQFGYNTIAIIIDDTNKRYQLVSGQSLPNGRYKKASKKAIRQKAEDLKASGYTEVKGPNSLSESVELKTGSAEDIMKGKAFSVKDTEILNTVMDALKSELGPDWEGKSLIDIEDITFNTIDEYSKDHNEDIDPQPYYTQLKMLIGRNDLSEGKDTKSDELSKEDIVNLLDNGHILTAGKKNYTPTEFLSEKGKIYFNNREISFGWQEHPSLKTADDLADFLLNLQKEGFEVTHSDRTEKDTITESASKEDTLTKLANKILDFYGEDMGNYFDEIAGKEEDVFNNILSSLENKDESDINKFIEDMEEDEGNEDTVNQLKSILNECKETLIEKDEVDEPDTVIEYGILFENGDDEFYSDKEEADKRFQEIIDNGNLEDVVQYYKKEWIKGEKDYEEGDVEVYYTEGDILHEELFGASNKVYQDSKEKGLYSENLK